MEVAAVGLEIQSEPISTWHTGDATRPDPFPPADPSSAVSFDAFLFNLTGARTSGSFRLPSPMLTVIVTDVDEV